MLEGFETLIKENRHIDAGVLFIENADPNDLETLHAFLSDLLPALIAHQAPWLIKNPAHIDRFLDLCVRALSTDYSPPQMVYNITHLRCYKAVALVVQQRTRDAHVEILKAASINQPMEPPAEKLESVPSPTALSAFFSAYFDYLTKQGYEVQVEKINWIVEKALLQLGEDESRAGVTRALLVNRDGKGLIRLVLVAIEEGEGIEYQHLGAQELGEELRSSAAAARQAADSYLRSRGYPEGLSHKKIIWQIARPDGRTEDIKTIYEGSSLGLALTMAILSAYVSQLVPTDIAFTGALNVHAAQTRELVGVSVVSEKLFAALRSGIRKVYLPLQNEADLSLAVRKAAEGTLVIRPIRTVDVACHDLISKPKEQGFPTILKEVLRNFFLFFIPRHKAAESLARKYSGHVLLSSALFASMYSVEGFLFHMERHNVSIGTIQRLLGHENRTTTEIYLHSLGNPEREAVRILERAESLTQSLTQQTTRPEAIAVSY